MNSWTLRARSRTDPREKMRPGSRVALTLERSPSSRARARRPLSILYLICVHMIHLWEISDAQWPPCDDPKGRTLSRSLKCRYICRRRTSRHKIFTRRRRRLALISLRCIVYFISHIRTQTHDVGPTSSHSRPQLLQFFQNNSFSDTEGINNISKKLNNCFNSLPLR